MARERVSTKETLKFTKEYTHGVTGDVAFVDAEVTVDYKRGTFYVDVGSFHIPVGFGKAIKLPKMVASADLLLEIAEFVEAELQGFTHDAR